MFNDFHENCCLPSSIKASYSVLIPKVSGSLLVQNFRPIALVHGMYKVVVKVLSKSLQPLLNGLISKN